MNYQLKRLYDATEDDVLFGIGLIEPSGLPAAPYIHLHYAGWSREMLELVRDSFADGLELHTSTRPSGEVDLHIATRQRMALQTGRPGETDVLRAPAWDARLDGVDQAAHRTFDEGRRRVGGYMVLVQTPGWEYLTAVDDHNRLVTVAEIRPRVLPMPADH